MPKFILIDPSIQGFQGHYYEYASRVLKAAAAQGYAPVMAGNRKCNLPRVGSIDIQPVYQDAFWSRADSSSQTSWSRSFLQACKRRLFFTKVNFLFSSVGLFLAIRGRFGEYLQSRSLKVRSIFPLLLLLGVVYVSRIIGAALVFCWHIIPFREYLRGYFSRLGTDAMQIVRVGVYPLVEGDIVFLSMASSLDLNALAQYFKQDANSSKATWHVLFRHQLFSWDGGSPVSETLRPLRGACYQLQSAMAGHRVYFYTDTDDLTAQYNSLQIFPFQTLPIPVADEYHRPRPAAQRRGPLQIAYVGDARQEKGYQHLPRIVEDLWAKYVATDRVVFAIQSNFNVPEGTPTTVIARAQLESFPPDKVKLYTQPLSPSDYRELVTSSDIILLPYHGHPYFAGSSGILVEALAAGIPVIAPDGIWMGKQFADETRRYHEMLAEKLNNLQTLTVDQMTWRTENKVRVRPQADGALGLGGGARGPYTKLRIPESAEFLLLSIGAAVRQATAPCQAWIDQLDRSRSSVQHSHYCLSPVTNGRRTLLVSLNADARSVIVQLSKGFPQAPDEIRDLRIDFLARKVPEEACPAGAVGLVFRDPGEISVLLSEMIDHFDHYKATAQAFSKEWFGKHQASRLVSQICQASQANGAALRAAA